MDKSIPKLISNFSNYKSNIRFLVYISFVLSQLPVHADRFMTKIINLQFMILLDSAEK